eukprot:IDg1813t1
MAQDGDQEVFMDYIDLEEDMPELAELIFSVRTLERRLLRKAIVVPQVVSEIADNFPPAMLFVLNIRGAPAAAFEALAAAANSPYQPASSSGFQQNKLADYIGMRFREKDSKFLGDLGESWIEYVAEFQQVAREYGHSLLRRSNISQPPSRRQDRHEELAVLKKEYKLITKLYPQVLISHRSEAQRIAFLQNTT